MKYFSWYVKLYKDLLTGSFTPAIHLTQVGDHIPNEWYVTTRRAPLRFLQPPRGAWSLRAVLLLFRSSAGHT